jgi:hypothetical protein
MIGKCKATITRKEGKRKRGTGIEGWDQLTSKRSHYTPIQRSARDFEMFEVNRVVSGETGGGGN